MLKDNLLILAFFTVWFGQYGQSDQAPDISTSGSSKQAIQKATPPPKTDKVVKPTVEEQDKGKVNEMSPVKAPSNSTKPTPIKGTDPKATTETTAKPEEGKSANQAIGTPTLLNGYLYEDEAVGKGEALNKGNKITVHFEAIDPEGNEVLSTKRRGLAYSFKIAEGEPLSTLIAGMKVGGQRRILVGPEFVNKGKGMQPVLPANTALLIRIWVLKRESGDPGR